MVLATTRADVNGVVRKRLDVRKASFAPMDTAVELTGMAYGGITPFGVPAGWPVLVDPAVLAAPAVVVGSGVRGSKLLVPGSVLGQLDGAEADRGPGPLGTSLARSAFRWLNLQRKAPSARRASCPPSPSPI